jgi:2-oxoglutarate dehydrogenase E2 component (dihydrolipoamide succinyltransferase)
MATNVVMPKMGESITEGTILRWLKQPGEQVKKDEPILEISTDKVDTEVPAPVAGVLLQQLVQEKETVGVGTPIAVIGAENEVASSAPAPKAAPAPKQEAAQSPAKQEAAPVQSKQEAAPQAAAPQSGNEQAVVMPKMGESITEGTILRWLKQPGDQVKKDEPILEISTDKVDTEVPSPFAGVLTKQLAQEKETVAVGDPVAYISTSGGAPAQASAPAAQPQPAPTPQPAQQTKPQPNGYSAPQPSYAAPAPQPSFAPVGRMSGSRFYSPLVRSIAKSEGIGLNELETIAGSGLGGRVNKNDILAYIQNRRSGAAAQPALRPSAPAVPAPSGARIDFSKGDLVIPMDNIRQKIAEHMVRSKHTSAHVTSVTEADVTEIVKYREQHKDEFKAREGVSLTYTPIFIDAMIRAIKDFPIINSSVDGTNIVVHKDINFGVAVSLPPQENSPLPPALIVPVIKRAQDLSMPAIARSVSELAGKARNKKLTPDDITGSTFTLTNPGMFGNLFGTPIINQPNVAIMTTGAVVKRVVVRTDEAGNDYMAIRSMMYLGLSYDHRLVDGQYGVQFTERVKYYLENFRPGSV